MSQSLELFGTKSCPYTTELREQLEWEGKEFDEHDVEADAEALARMVALSGQRTVPVLVEAGRVVQIGFQGRGCLVATTAAP